MKLKKLLLLFVALVALTGLVGSVFAQNQTATTPTSTFDLEQLQQTVSFLIIFIGILARAFLPYIRKWLANEPIGGFQKRYIPIISASFVTAWLAYPQFTIAFTDWWQILTASFVFGFGLQSSYTEVYAWFETAVKQEEQSTTTPPTT